MAFHTAPRAVRAAFFMLACCILLSGCLSTKSYVDPALPIVAKSDLRAPEHPRPVHVLFEFKTKGNANARGTDQLRGRVVAAAAESGLFQTVAGTPGDDSTGLLKISINNVADTDNAVAKGVGTGLTFGLAGSLVTDGYICEATYSYAGKSTQATVRHSLHTTVGNHSGPEGLVAVQMADGVNTVIDQLVLNALKSLNDQKAFEP